MVPVLLALGTYGGVQLLTTDDSPSTPPTPAELTLYACHTRARAAAGQRQLVEQSSRRSPRGESAGAEKIEVGVELMPCGEHRPAALSDARTPGAQDVVERARVAVSAAQLVQEESYAGQ